MEQRHGVVKTLVYASNNDVRAVKQEDQETGQKQCLHQKCRQPETMAGDQVTPWETMVQGVIAQVGLRMEVEQAWPT